MTRQNPSYRLRVRSGVAGVAGHGYGSNVTHQSEGNRHATLNAMGKSDEVGALVAEQS